MRCPQGIRSREYACVWCALPAGRESLPPHKWQAIIAQLALWLRSAQESGCHAVISGNRGQVCQQLEPQELLSDHLAYESQHAKCRAPTDRHLEIIHLYTAQPLTETRCKCPAGKRQQDHLTGRARTRTRVDHAEHVYRALASRLSFIAIEPDRRRSPGLSRTEPRPDEHNHSHTHDRPNRRPGKMRRRTYQHYEHEPTDDSSSVESSHDQPSADLAELAFPTEAREHAKERLTTRHKPGKRKKPSRNMSMTLVMICPG